MFSLSPAWDATTYHRPTHHPALSLVLLEYLLQFCLTTLQFCMSSLLYYVINILQAFIWTKLLQGVWGILSLVYHSLMVVVLAFYNLFSLYMFGLNFNFWLILIPQTDVNRMSQTLKFKPNLQFLPKGNGNNYPKLYGDSYCMALRTKSACPHKVALGCQMWWGRGIFLVRFLGPYGMCSAAGYPSSSHSSGRRPNPGGKFPACPSRRRLSRNVWWSSGRFSNGDECFGTATGSWCILLSYCSTEGS
jgi:hypothetical protein